MIETHPVALILWEVKPDPREDAGSNAEGDDEFDGEEEVGGAKREKTGRWP